MIFLTEGKILPYIPSKIPLRKKLRNLPTYFDNNIASLVVIFIQKNKYYIYYIICCVLIIY